MTTTRKCINCGERLKAGQKYLCLVCYYDAWARLGQKERTMTTTRKCNICLVRLKAGQKYLCQACYGAWRCRMRKVTRQICTLKRRMVTGR